MSLLDDYSIIENKSDLSVREETVTNIENWLIKYSYPIYNIYPQDRVWAHSKIIETEYISNVMPSNGDPYRLSYRILCDDTNVMGIPGMDGNLNDVFLNKAIEQIYICKKRQSFYEYFSTLKIVYDNELYIEPCHAHLPILIKDAPYIPEFVKFRIPPGRSNYIKMIDCADDIIIDNCMVIRDYSIKFDW